MPMNTTTAPELDAILSRIPTTNRQSTKSIAYAFAVPTATVNAIARDLSLPMSYRSDLRHWEIADYRTAVRFIAHLVELRELGAL